MSVEETVKDVIVQALDIKSDEIVVDKSLAESLEVDSTEMVEIAVGIKKALNIEIDDNELKKLHTFNEIIEILKTKVPSNS